MVDLTKADLNLPAFGEGSQKVADLEPKESPAPAPQAEVEKVEAPVKEPEASVEEPENEQKVPYSRFKKFHDETLHLREELAEWKRKVEEAPEPAAREEADIPTYWKELYGDSDASKRAWSIQSEQNEALLRQAQEKAIEALRLEREQEAKRSEENLGKIDDHLEQVSAVAGRDLTEKEQSTILDIIDEFTPKSDDGSYAGALLSPDKAWEIYELKNQLAKVSKSEARDKVAALNGSQSQGDPNIEAEKNKSFNPLNWDAYKKRL